MKETRIKCLSCNIGNDKHEVTGEIMHVAIKIDERDLPEKECINEKCNEKTLVKA